jgi:hypothetical protein
LLEKKHILENINVYDEKIYTAKLKEWDKYKILESVPTSETK